MKCENCIHLDVCNKSDKLTDETCELRSGTCKDCEHYFESKMTGTMKCDITLSRKSDDGFCDEWKPKEAK